MPPLAEATVRAVGRLRIAAPLRASGFWQTPRKLVAPRVRCLASPMGNCRRPSVVSAKRNAAERGSLAGAGWRPSFPRSRGQRPRRRVFHETATSLTITRRSIMGGALPHEAGRVALALFSSRLVFRLVGEAPAWRPGRLRIDSERGPLWWPGAGDRHPQPLTPTTGFVREGF